MCLVHNTHKKSVFFQCTVLGKNQDKLQKRVQFKNSYCGLSELLTGLEGCGGLGRDEACGDRTFLAWHCGTVLYCSIVPQYFTTVL